MKKVERLWPLQPLRFRRLWMAIAHAQAQHWKGSSSHRTALLQSMEGAEYYATVATKRAGYVLYRALVSKLLSTYM